MPDLRKPLYPFLGVHSFLIGLFPFYIPVYLFSTSSSLEQVCAFVAFTGSGFCLWLWLWDKARQKVTLRNLIIVSFLSELVLLTCFLLEKNLTFLLLAGFFNGVFNCNFWIIQRLLFLETINLKNSGKKFGDFQIFVVVILKVAIFIGGVLLEASGFFALFLLSSVIVGLASLLFSRKNMRVSLNREIIKAAPLSVRAIVSFKDRLHSRSIFAIDGAFLYLESYFWLISLFLIVRESFWKLGLLVIALTLFFGIIFIFIKNSIDRLPVNIMYRGAVLLYSLSWLLRSLVAETIPVIYLLLLLTMITFCTSFFRLAFNKRFFDIAKSTTAHEYIFIKSYFSQFFLILFFAAPLLIYMPSGNVIQQLSIVYFVSAFVAVIYLLYRTPEQSVR